MKQAPKLRERLSIWLLRPYLDLGPFAMGPLHARAIEECWRAIEETNLAAFLPQRAMPPGFRAQLAAEAGGAPYDLSDPRQLPDGLRTQRWRELCEALDHWAELPTQHRCRLACLLHALCLYRPLVELIADRGREAWDCPWETQLSLWRASARYMLGLPGRTSDYEDAEMGVFTDIAWHAAGAVQTRFNATAMVFVHKAKTGAPVHELAGWADRFERALADATAQCDDFEAELLASRYFRATGFLPQRKGQREEVVRVMDRAERHARAMTPSSPAQEHLYLENLHALLESRTKEALWLGDEDRALACSLEVTNIDPYDAKAWVELGQIRFVREEWREAAGAYAASAMLGPPASAVGRHMAGVCLRKCGEDLLAALFFKDTLDTDPLGISSREEVHRLPDAGVLRALQDWTRSTLRL